MNSNKTFYFILIYCTLNLKLTLSLSKLNGKYTRGINNFALAVPHKLTEHGHFETFQLPHFVEHTYGKRRRRDLTASDKIHYGVHLDGKLHHLELIPNHDFVSPSLVIEHRDPTVRLNDQQFRKYEHKRMCHFTGNVKNVNGSKVALSACDGLAGFISVDTDRYFIEPLAEHVPNDEGQHLHVVYKKSTRHSDSPTCGTKNWEESWKQRFREKYAAEGFNQTKRGLKSEHRYLETAVVLDKKFIEHHKKIDYETYVMTLMNMVSDYYHDASSGNQMDVVIVRIIFLEKEEEEIDLIINPDADKTLRSFCNWQIKINPKDKENPNHHDIAVLITRYDICSDNMTNCGLMGLAYVAAACTGNDPCAICEEGGLVTSVVIAHEMGHVMGCSHDKEGESSCPAQDADESFFVMAPYVNLFTLKWSTCSKEFMTALFENGLGDCLNDEPKDTLYPFRNVLPGTIYDTDAQCSLLLPKSYGTCSSGSDNFCELLVCRVSPTTCWSKDEPVADGTKCGENKWCYRKECIEIGERPEAVNGGWGEWSSWTSCSRTCGMGVSIAERDCNNPAPQNRGRYCLGERKKTKTCNPEPCPDNGKSFRELQCEETNKEPMGGKLYNWRSYFKDDEPCALYCQNDVNQFSKRAPRVQDGTKCRGGSKDICVAGVCVIVGCDLKLNSNSVEDVCGICNGDGTQCKIVDETYADKGARDYKKIVTIPAGSRKIVIDELGPSENTIAISDKTEKNYYLNANHNEELDGVKHFGKIEGIYTHTEPGRENLVINGPITDDLIFWVCFYEPENVGYYYKYAELSKETIYKPKYHWELLEWSDCSQKCGSGIQTAKYDCVEEKSGKVSPSFCKDTPTPQAEPKKCNERPCATKWKVGNWGKCHACKDKSGVRIREVECVREAAHPGAQDVLVEDSECREVKPGTRELCDAHSTCSRKRHTDNLPDHMMKTIKLQTGSVLRKREGCSSDKTTTNLPKISLKVGEIVKDRIPPDEIKLVKIPFRQSHLSFNMSDNAFESMGDEVADTLDLNNAKIVTGAPAAKLLASEEEENCTITTKK